MGQTRQEAEIESIFFKKKSHLESQNVKKTYEPKRSA